VAVVAIATAVLAAGCGDSSHAPADQTVRARIDALAPSANLGHRGFGLSRAGNPYPENSLAAFQAAMAAGADGIELDVELTSDGALLVMHDDTLDRTTSCAGCVSAYTLAEAQDCRLLDGDGVPTDTPPPTLAESYAALPDDALVNVELKVYGAECSTPTTGAEALAEAAVAEVVALGALERTIFSSFDATAAATVENVAPDAYSALLLSLADSTAPAPATQLALDLGLDAIHPFLLIDQAGLAAALDAGLQVNVWTVNGATTMNETIDKGSSAIITDQPDVLAAVLAERRGAR
jgi:glycerophosphoryl diester phosphodiesterase